MTNERQALIDELLSYQPFNELEASHVSRVIDFVRKNDDCFERSNLSGHITGSGWIIDEENSHTLLIHHKKLDRWLQPGGHADGNPNVVEVATMEVNEETGLSSVKVVPEIFDVDVHLIPEHKSIPAHFHYDIRYLFISHKDASLALSEESNDLKWVAWEELPAHIGDEQSLVRLYEKCKSLPGAD